MDDRKRLVRKADGNRPNVSLSSFGDMSSVLSLLCVKS